MLCLCMHVYTRIHTCTWLGVRERTRASSWSPGNGPAQPHSTHTALASLLGCLSSRPPGPVCRKTPRLCRNTTAAEDGLAWQQRLLLASLLGPRWRGRLVPGAPSLEGPPAVPWHAVQMCSVYSSKRIAPSQREGAEAVVTHVSLLSEMNCI